MPLICEKRRKKKKKVKKDINKSVRMVSEYEVLLVVSTHSPKRILGFIIKLVSVTWYGDVCF